MRPGCAADHSPPSSAAVMEEYSYTCTHPLGHTGPVTVSLYLFLCAPNKIQFITSSKLRQVSLSGYHSQGFFLELRDLSYDGLRFICSKNT